MAKIKVTPSTLDTLATQATNAAEQIRAARGAFQAAAGIGAGFEDGGLEGQYNQAYQHALTMAENYAAYLEAHAKALRAASVAYATSDTNAAGLMHAAEG